METRLREVRLETRKLAKMSQIVHIGTWEGTREQNWTAFKAEEWCGFCVLLDWEVGRKVGKG